VWNLVKRSGVSCIPLSLSLSLSLYIYIYIYIGMSKDIQGCITTHAGLYVEYP